MTPPPTPPLAPPRPRAGFLVAAVVLLATLFLFASPASFSLHRGWPWDWDDRARTPTALADLLLWAGAALAAAACGLRRGGPFARAAAIALGVVVAVRAHGAGAALPIERPEALGLSYTALLALLAGGALAAARRPPGEVARRAAGALLVGAAGTAFLLAAWPEHGRSGVALLLARWGQVRQGLFLGAELEDATRAAMARDLCWYLVPPLLQAAAAVAGLFLAARLRRAPADGSAAGRPLAVAVLALLAGSALVPVLGALGAFGATVRDALTSGPAGVLAGALVGQGLAIGTLLAVLGADVLLGSVPAARPTAPPGEVPARAGARWPFAVALLALGVLVLAAYNPAAGLARRAWPWEGPFRAPWADDVLPLPLAAAVAVACGIALALRRSALAAALAAAAAVCAVDVLLRGATPEALLETYAVDAWAPVLAAATAGGVVLAARGRALDPRERTALAVAGAALLLLLAHPLEGAGNPELMSTSGWGSGSLGVLLDRWIGGASGGPEAAVGTPTPWIAGVLGHLAVGVAALALAARGRGRALALALVAAWAATVFVAPVHALLADPPPPGGGESPPGRAWISAARTGALVLAAAWTGWIIRRDSSERNDLQS